MTVHQVIIMHDSVREDSNSDMLDTLVQVDYVKRLIHDAGFKTRNMAFHDDPALLAPSILNEPPSLIFNLVETLSGSKHLHHAPELFESLGILYTGSGPAAMMLTSDKPLAKHMMRIAGIPTPDWCDANYKIGFSTLLGRSVLVKPAYEDASIGLSHESVISKLDQAKAEDVLGRADLFLEEYIDGREFNVSILEINNEPIVLSPAEIVFDAFPENTPKIVGYSAKWDVDSFEYQHTIRVFPFPHISKEGRRNQEEGRRNLVTTTESDLCKDLCTIARKCWELFGLRGYARVDFRVDGQGNLWVLEVNANPCISPDSGFIAAAAHDGINPSEVVLAIMKSAKIDLQCCAPLPIPEESPIDTTREKMSADECPEPESVTSDKTQNKKDQQGDLVQGISEIFFREEPSSKDLESVRSILASSGFFTQEEIDIGVSLVQERLHNGLESEYFFLFAQRGIDGEVIGYTCYGPIPGTESGFDLYWIAVRYDARGEGLGKELLRRTEASIRDLGGERVYAETSSTEKYAPTRSFYESNGYKLASVLEHFYRTNDHKCTYVTCVI